MATRSAIECPVCHQPMGPGQKLEQHLVDDHRKNKLAKFVAAEAIAWEEEDISA